MAVLDFLPVVATRHKKFRKPFYFRFFKQVVLLFFLCCFTKHRLLVLTERIGTISSRLSIRRVLPPPPNAHFLSLCTFRQRLRSSRSTFSSLILFAIPNCQLSSQLPTFLTSSNSLSYHPLSIFDTWHSIASIWPPRLTFWIRSYSVNCHCLKNNDILYLYRHTHYASMSTPLSISAPTVKFELHVRTATSHIPPLDHTEVFSIPESPFAAA